MMRLLYLRKSAMESLAHNLQQKCWVSGTAKGKGKIKAGVPLKRSKVSTKKGAAIPDPSAKSSGPRRSEFEQTVDDCLRSTAPIRFLKPKERAREAEREKMGLLSEARKQEIQQLKKQKKLDKTASSSVIGVPGLDLISLGMVDEDKIPKYELTVEDGRRLAKEYSRVLMRKHRARQVAETNLLKCKKAAIEALPDELREKALVPDLAPFPVNRFMATLTPPIEGYIEKINEAARRSSGKAAQKLR